MVRVSLKMWQKSDDIEEIENDNNILAARKADEGVSAHCKRRSKQIYSNCGREDLDYWIEVPYFLR